MTDWETKEIARLTAEYGTVPPPWVLHPTYHPLSMGWRMGKGESSMMIWDGWWVAQSWDESQRIEYFRQFEPPHVWLLWVMWALWPEANEQFFQEDWEDGIWTVKPYFERLEALGFGSFDNWKQDFERKGWD